LGSARSISQLSDDGLTGYAMLQRLFRKKAVKIAARRLYDQLSAAARDPSLYGLGRVADTPDGRFELLALHSAILFARLAKRGEQADETAQEVFDILFSAMDHALRELGVGDISVGKRIRKLAESFYGRMAVYHDALAQGADGQATLIAAIATHALESQAVDHPFAQTLAQRVTKWTANLAEQEDSALLSGDMALPN
jgi:cytochrome b pre-mRNA-processing protein 3